jgi:hypothetical protein
VLRQVILDLALVVTFIVTLGFQVTGGKVHEWIGLFWCILALVHFWWNRRWLFAFFKGSYSLRRFINASVVLLLCIGLLTICVTGLMNSSHVLGSMELAGNFEAKRIHTIASYWSLLLIGVHLGIQWKTVLNVLRASLGWPASSGITHSALRFFLLIMVFIGIWASFDRQIGTKLFHGAAFDFWNPDRPYMLLFAFNFAILGIYVIVTHCIFSYVKSLALKKHD